MGTSPGTLIIPVRFEAKQHIVTDAFITIFCSQGYVCTQNSETGMWVVTPAE